ncbi:MAG: Hpt domain-containing protein [Leptospiraceae bacterium]|nr:Hpt domain-containing protein [Leptospiraceae bacterium]MBK7058042.1 Hpt domain-containing protein [Leptospiraceae bacterium]MBK9501814.1 Hpt domain-containing protein [Leptospiraceae bacterium]MBL0264596.1 Hpt domain-containing protein [Leptospiraceae bacterium]MBP9165236.1 Hpt domain-containing protein [Leptospiraceae bacterium]
MTDSKAEILVEISKDLEDLIPEYIDSMNSSIEYIEGLVKSNNLVEVKSEAHKMKGHGGAYGFRYISDIGLLIEGFAKEGKNELILKCLQELKNYMRSIKIEFREDE